MAGGTMTIWPYFCGHFVELPYTLAQDYTLFVVARQTSPKLWLDKIGFIAAWGGMALLNAHPDYLRVPANLAIYEEFLRQLADGTWRRITMPATATPANEPRRGTEPELARPGADPAGTHASYWHALPRDVAAWWRSGRRPLADMEEA